MRELDTLVTEALDADEAALTQALGLDDLLTDLRRRTRRRRVVRAATTSVSSAAAVGLVAVGAYALAGADDARPQPADTTTPHETATPTPTAPATTAPTQAPTQAPSQSPTPDAGPRTVPTADPAAVRAAGDGLRAYGPDGSLLTPVDGGTGGPVRAQASDFTAEIPGIDGSAYRLEARLSDGSYLVTHPTTDDDAYPPVVLATWDGTTLHPWASTDTVVDDGQARVLGNVTVTDGWVVWMESTGYDAWLGRWRVFAARDDGSDLHLVARSEEWFTTDHDETMSGAQVAVVDGRVYWSTYRADLVSAAEQRARDAVVVSRALDGSGEIRVEAVGVELLAGGYGRLAMGVLEDGDVVAGIALLEDGDLRTVVANGPPEAAVGDGYLAFAVDEYAYVLRLDEPRLTRVAMAGVEDVMYVASGPDHVGWVASYPDRYEHVRYDLATDTLRTTDASRAWATSTGSVASPGTPATWTIVTWHS